MADEPITNPELDAIGEAIKAGDEYGLAIEVLWSAMHYLMEKPNATIGDACTFGIMEWIK